MLDQYIANQATSIVYANRILEHSEGRPVTNPDSLNAQCIAIYSWRHFSQSNNTFQEMTNSGNLALLSNDSIKNMLLNLESAYELLKSEEDHFRFDAEELLYTPLYAMVDLNPVVDNFAWHASGGKAGKNSALSARAFEKFLKDVKVKNGFVMVKLEFGTMNDMMTSIKAKSERLVHIIDREMKR